MLAARKWSWQAIAGIEPMGSVSLCPWRQGTTLRLQSWSMLPDYQQSAGEKGPPVEAPRVYRALNEVWTGESIGSSTCQPMHAPCAVPGEPRCTVGVVCHQPLELVGEREEPALISASLTALSGEVPATTVEPSSGLSAVRHRDGFT